MGRESGDEERIKFNIGKKQISQVDEVLHLCDFTTGAEGNGENGNYERLATLT